MVKQRKDFPHQTKALKAAVKHYETHSVGQLNMACGTGKTHVALRLVTLLKSQRTLVLVPTLSLVAQFIKDWRALHGNSYRMMAVCCDDTVGHRNTDTYDITQEELHATTGIFVSTEVSEVTNFMRGNVPFVVFSTYTSSPVVALAQKHAKVPTFDFAVADEAHHTATHLHSDWATILKPKAIKAVKRLYMTATPKVYKAADTLDGDDIVAASMDNHKLFGDVFYNLPFGKAIDLDLLCDYRVVIATITDEEVQALVNNRILVEVLGSTYDARTLAMHVAVWKAQQQYGIKKMLTFHSRCKSAHDFAYDHIKVARVMGKTRTAMYAEYIDSTVQSKDRVNLLNTFAAQPDSTYALISNALCLSEGVDVPAMDGVGLMDPKTSVVGITQATGRVMRKSGGKTRGTIIIPVFISHKATKLVKSKNGAGELEEVDDECFEGSDFDTVRRVLLALRMSDDGLTRIFSHLQAATTLNTVDGVSPRMVQYDEWVGLLKTGLAKVKLVEASDTVTVGVTTKNGKVYDKRGYEVVIPMDEKLCFTGKLINRSVFAKAICNRVVRWNVNGMEYKALRLVKFMRDEGRQPDPQSENPEEVMLAKWAAQLRAAGRKAGYSDEE